MGSSLFAMEVTLSRCNVRGLLSSCGRGDTLQFWWVGSSLIVAIGFSLCGIGLPSNSGGVLGLLSRCRVPHLGVFCGVGVLSACCFGAPVFHGVAPL